MDGSSRTSGCSVRSLLSDAMTRWRSVTSACSRLPMSACSASGVPMRTSTVGSSRRGSSGVFSSRRRRSISGISALPYAPAPSRRRRSARRGRGRRAAARISSSRTTVARRSNRFARDSLVGILDQPAEQIEKRVGDQRDERARPRRVRARRSGPGARHHRLHQRARRVEVLRRAGRRRGTPPCRRESRSPRSRRASESAPADRRASRALR